MKRLRFPGLLGILCVGVAAHGADIGSGLPLLDAVRAGDRALVEQLLRQGEDPNALGESGETALHLSSAMARFGIAKMLLNYGANPNLGDHNGMTPLIAAAGAIAEGNAVEATVSLLLERGADPNPQEAMMSPLAFAMQRDHAGAITALREAGAVLADSESATMLTAVQELNRKMKSAVFEATRMRMTESEFADVSREAIQSYREALLGAGLTVPDNAITEFVDNSREQYRQFSMKANRSEVTQ